MIVQETMEPSSNHPPAAALAEIESVAPFVRRSRTVLLMLEDLGGGTGNHVCRIAAEWSARGWNVTIVTQTPPVVHSLPSEVDIRLIANAGWYDRFPLAQVRRLFELARVVRELRPDVVHTYFFWSIMYGRILKMLGMIPVLVENREDLGFSWGSGPYGVLRMTRGVPDRIVCVAEAVRGMALRRERAGADRVTVIRNGVQMLPSRTDRREARQRFGFGEEHVVVGMVANLPRAVKGGRHLLDAVAAIVRQAPNVRFLLVGQGTERTTLEPELLARGIAGFVVGAGHQRAVEACYSAMDVSVLTSSSEGLSITLLESMRQGLPTVVTRVGGNPEVVLDGVTGFLVPFGDAAAFVDRVVALARDARLRVAMGQAGRHRVAEHFAIDEVAKRYLAVYEGLLAGDDGSPGVPAAGEIN